MRILLSVDGTCSIQAEGARLTLILRLLVDMKAEVRTARRFPTASAN